MRSHGQNSNYPMIPWSTCLENIKTHTHTCIYIYTIYIYIYIHILYTIYNIQYTIYNIIYHISYIKCNISSFDMFWSLIYRWYWYCLDLFKVRLRYHVLQSVAPGTKAKMSPELWTKLLLSDDALRSGWKTTQRWRNGIRNGIRQNYGGYIYI